MYMYNQVKMYNNVCMFINYNIIGSFMSNCISLLPSEYPRKKLVQDGQAISKYLMMRTSRKNETKSGSNKTVLGKLLMGILVM